MLERNLLYSTALKAAIELRCVSQRKLCKRLGINLGTFRSYTSGRRVPRKVVHLALCEVLLVDLPYSLPKRKKYLAKRGLPK